MEIVHFKGRETMNHSEFPNMLKDRTTYKFWVKDRVRFNDLDALGHVSSVRMNEYFAGVRTHLFRQAIKGWFASEQLPVIKLSIVQHEREIEFPADLDVGLVVEKFGNSSVTLATALFDAVDCLALCRTVLVFIDAKMRLPTPPSDLIKQNFLRLAGQTHCHAG
jgi:acyl-CoA thioester hydrolase